MTRRRSRAVVGAILVLAGVSWGCREKIVIVIPDETTNPLIQTSMEERRIDCPDHNRVKLLGQGEDSTIYTALSVPKNITLVPEFHDCQRLLEGPAASYGPLVGIFASNTLAVVDTTASAIAPQDLTGRAPVAELVNFDQVPYADLGIQPGFNCLYMFRDAAATNGIRAVMVPVSVETDCLKNYDVSMTGTQLLVIPHTPPAPLNWEDIPPVARWDWDPVEKVQYIGIRCAQQWCEVGPEAGFGSSPNHHHPFEKRREKRTFWVKGWYDEQQLAFKFGNGLKPLPAFGTIVPDSALGDYVDTDFPADTWVPAAKVIVRPPNQLYRDKLGLEAGNIPGKMNRLQLCKGSWAACRASSGESPAQPTVNCTGSTDTWWARMIPPSGGAAKYFCVTRTPHTHAIPGTARWRWQVDDETIWVRCAEGCCQVNSDFT